MAVNETHINYLFDTARLPMFGGTFDHPVGSTGGQGYGHIMVYEDGEPIYNTPQPGSTLVQVPQNSEIVITFSDLNGNPAVVMAPNRMLVHSWRLVTDQSELYQIFQDSTRKPIDTPQFNVKPTRYSSLAYASGQPTWQKSVSPFANWSAIGIGLASKSESATTYGPSISFNTQYEIGILKYGLEFSVMNAGRLQGYYWFDPRIQIIGGASQS